MKPEQKLLTVSSLIYHFISLKQIIQVHLHLKKMGFLLWEESMYITIFMLSLIQKKEILN